jgi:hypothetical protein
VCVCVFNLCVCVFLTCVCVCVCALPLSAHSRGRHGRGPVVFIAQPRQSDGHVCSFDLVTGRSRALAAGVTWTSRTTSAPWAARNGHTTVIDAAGAIYVIGGFDGQSKRDVWASTDGGADWTKSGVSGVQGGYHGVLRGVL